MAALLTRALRREGLSVMVEHEGQGALDMDLSGYSDVILLDFMLPPQTASPSCATCASRGSVHRP